MSKFRLGHRLEDAKLNQPGLVVFGASDDHLAQEFDLLKQGKVIPLVQHPTSIDSCQLPMRSSCRRR